MTALTFTRARGFIAAPGRLGKAGTACAVVLTSVALSWAAVFTLAAAS